MLSPKYYLYLALGASGQTKIELTGNPRVDAYYLYQHGYQEIYILQPPQPIWVAEIVLHKLTQFTAPTLPKDFSRIASQILREVSQQKHPRVQQYNIDELRLKEFDPPDLAAIFAGRSLLGTEIPDLIRSSGFDLPWDPEVWLQYLYLQSQVEREAAVGVDSLGIPFCRRCGENQAIMEDNCIFCGNLHCFTCTNCRTMGVAKSCIPLYSKAHTDSYEVQIKFQPRLEFALTPPQQRASLALENFFESGQRQFLVWAVCGAGKTEVGFGVIAKALSAGARVLFAIPRKDVVIELLPRLQQAFPETAIIALYGGGGERFQDVPLTIATTHQCLRFYQGFDLVILDEADAYPYQGSAMLHYAVKRSLKPGGRLIIMTATPDKALMRKAYSGELPYVSIPARYHRKPLIMPELIKLNLEPRKYKTDWTPPLMIQEFIIRLKNSGRRGLIFLPTIKLIEEYGPVLVSWACAKGVPGEFTHSKTANRSDVKSTLLHGEIFFVVTSTIFERGITIPNLDVMVLCTDNEMIFDSQTLVQIAGRAGRLGEAGRVLFAAKTFSRAMKEAVQIIKSMNREGFELGYLDSK